MNQTDPGSMDGWSAEAGMQSDDRRQNVRREGGRCQGFDLRQGDRCLLV